MQPPRPINRGQGNQFYPTNRPDGPQQRGQVAPYGENGAPPGTDWGEIGGTLSDQSDLVAALGVKITLVAAPATSSSAGAAGQFAYASGFIYVCTATSTWKRVAISTF